MQDSGVPWLCSRSQPGIKVIIRDLGGHLLPSVTFLVICSSFSIWEQYAIHIGSYGNLIVATDFHGKNEFLEDNKEYLLMPDLRLHRPTKSFEIIQLVNRIP